MYVLLCVAAALTGVWGVAHLRATRGVAADYGEPSTDDRRIISTEWIVEGVALVSPAALVAPALSVSSQVRKIYGSGFHATTRHRRQGADMTADTGRDRFYEPPVLLRLQGGRAGRAECFEDGSSDAGACSSGTTPGGACGYGAGAPGGCGNGATAVSPCETGTTPGQPT